MKRFFLLTVVISSLLALSSCEKKTENYPFTIRVVTEVADPDNPEKLKYVPVQNASIEAGAPIPDALPDFTGSTNIDGIISFEYQYEAVLQVNASRGTNPVTHVGCGFIKLEDGKNVEITIVLQDYDPSQSGC